VDDGKTDREDGLFHVSSSLNRDSIAAHGLDVTRMAAARGIAGSRQPEEDGCFLARGEWEADWFVRMNNTGGPVDVWAVDGVRVEQLVPAPNGFVFFPGTVPASSLTLVRRDIPPEP